MPLSKEKIPNKNLKGTELKKIIMDDILEKSDEMLSRDAMMKECAGYSLVTYEVLIKLKLANPSYPEHKIKITAKTKETENVMIVPSPMTKEAKDPVKMGSKRTRVINNPNKERIVRGMPLSVEVNDPKTGRMVGKEIKINQEDVSAEELGSKNEDVTDTKDEGGWDL